MKMNVKRLLSMILSLVMLASIFVLGTTAAEVSPYTDVKTSRWSYNDIMYVTEKGLMNGTTADKFAPGETMTRAMVVTVLYRLQGEPAVEYKSTFTDVKNNKWFTDAVIWAAENKIVEGKGNGIFAPTETITREQLATIIMRYAPMEYIITEERADITGYADYKRVHDYAKDALSWANAIGLITGKTADTLAPREGATREQFAKILRCFKEYDSYKYELVYNSPKPLSTYTEKPYELVTDADIYVAVDGNDANPGTLEKPVKTFAKAKEMVRELKKTATEEIKVAFKAGDYGVLDNLTFTAEDSGTADVPVTYCAYGDGEVYFTNGIYIDKSEFKSIDEADKAYFAEANYDKIKKIDLTEILAANGLSTVSGLFSESGFCYPARVPNKSSNGSNNYYTGFTMNVATPDSPYTMEEIMAEATANGYLNEHTIIRPYTEQKKLKALYVLRKKMDTYHTFENAQICGYVSKVWHEDYLDIKSYDKETGIMEFYNDTNYGFVNVDETQRCYISNISEELDWNGEYWFEPNTKNLYVYDPQGNYSIPTNGSFVTVEKNVNNISFTKLNFRVCSNDAIRVFGDNFTMDLCSITNVGGEHAFFSEGVLNTVITNSTFAYCAETGVSAEGPEPGDRDDYDYYALNGTGFVFENNYIHHVDMVYIPVESGALKVRWQVGGKIAHNEISDSARYGIDYKYGNIDCVFEYNYIHHCMTDSADGGALYCGRVATNRGNIVRYNIIADIYAYNSTHTGGTYAVYLDDHMEDFIGYGNVFYNCGSIMNNKGRSHTIHDNVFIGETGITSNEPTFLDIRDYATEVYTEGWNSLDRIPDENTPNGQIWKERWPELYDILAIRKNPDIDVTTLDLYSKALNYCHNNYHFDGAESSYGSAWLEFGDNGNNLIFTLAENPIFVNPSIGDYSIREGVDFADNRFAEIGRY